MTITSEDAILSVENWLAQLEASVVAAERALRRREWKELGEEMARQRRSSHGLKNALESQPNLTAEARKKVDERVDTILQRRDVQLRRLESFHLEVGRRLRELTQFKLAVKEMAVESKAIALNIKR
jgi:hypothetical protein